MSADMMSWYCVVNAEGLVLAVYGSKLADEAAKRRADINHRLGDCSAFVRMVRMAYPRRPSIGDVLPAEVTP